MACLRTSGENNARRMSSHYQDVAKSHCVLHSCRRRPPYWHKAVMRDITSGKMHSLTSLDNSLVMPAYIDSSCSTTRKYPAVVGTILTVCIFCFPIETIRSIKYLDVTVQPAPRTLRDETSNDDCLSPNYCRRMVSTSVMRRG